MKLMMLALAVFAFLPQDPAPAPQDGQTHTVAKGTLTLAIDAEGTFEAVAPFEVRLRHKAYAGELTITSIAPHSAVVKKGDIVLALDSANAKKQLAAAENDAEAARANTKKAEADAQLGAQSDQLAMKMVGHELQNAEAEMKYWEEMDGPHFLKRLELRLLSSRDNIADQKDELDQLEKMYKSEELTNATADIVMKRAVRQYERSLTYLAMAEKENKKELHLEYGNAKAQVVNKLEKARQDMAALKAVQEAGQVLRKTGLVAARAALAAAEEHLADLKSDWEAFTIKAPMDGVVLYGQLLMGQWQGNDSRLLRVGEKAQPQMVLMTLFTPGKLKVAIDVPESQLFWIKPGMKGQVAPAALNDVTYEATLSSISPAGLNKGPAQTFEAELDLPSVDERLAPGMKASVHIAVAELKDVLLVPAGALSRGRVWLKGKDGKDEARTVGVGKSDGQWTEIKSGLAAGDVVLSVAKK